MVLDLRNHIAELHQERGISEDLIVTTIETAITKAYEKLNGTIENLVIKNNDDYILSVFSRKEVVEKVDDDLFEISLKDAKDIDEAAEIGDEMLVPCNPDEFGRLAINTAKQIVLQRLREIEKNTIYSDFKSKEGELIIGYIQRKRGDLVFLDIGNYEGVLPKRNQPPHEVYHIGERLKTLVEEVKRGNNGRSVSVILSRSSSEFVRKLLEIEIPEVYDKTVEIFKIEREPGYRTKIAVFSQRDEIDPVGSCVGQKGIRIQNIIKELEGEKIDVIRWSIDIKMFIQNALIPAKVDDVIILDEVNKKALAIVDEENLSYAIGKRGLNIKLVNRLTEWNIDVKTALQAKELGLMTDHVKEAEDLFKSDDSANLITNLEIPYNIKEVLNNNEYYSIEDVIELSIDEIKNLNGMDDEMATYLKDFVDKNYEIVIDDEPDTELVEDEEVILEDGVEYYECPNCGAKITDDISVCPSCGIEIAFEEEDEE